MGFSAKAEKLLTSNQPIFGNWNIQAIIGEGSSGTVYEISDNCGNRGALKIISISNVDDDSSSLLAFNSDSDRAEAYIDEMTVDIIDEVKILHSLCGKKGIVGCREYGMLETKDEEGTLRLILIRMDLLQSLNKIMRSDKTEFTPKDVVKMGIDLCSALIECRKQNIIHRDIKPANIFVTQSGEYQLGDFGSAKLLEHTMMASRKGTLAYIAPEIASGQSYNATVDLYSLGIVMYQLLNNRRLPFLEENFKFSDMETAIEKRLNGALLSPPCNADERLGQIICKMCAYSPKERYASAEECKTDLENYISSENKHIKKLKPPKKLVKFLLSTVAVIIIALSATLIFTKFNTDYKLTAHISSGNVNSSGMIACDGKWIYTNQDKSGERGYRISVDGSQKEILCDYIMYDVNITNKYVVFSDESFTGGLYRMEKDGSNLICLDDSKVMNPVVYGKYVYYIVAEDDFNVLCRIPVEGGTIDELGAYDKYTCHFYLANEYIYIYSHAKKQLIRTNLNGDEKQTIIEKSLMSFCIDNGKLYFVQADYNALSQIYVYSLDDISDESIDTYNENITKIDLPHRTYEFNVADGVIYFSTNLFASRDDEPQEDGIWRVNDDGSGMRQIHSGNSTQVQIVSGKIYFCEDSAMFSMNPDGKNIQKMQDIGEIENNDIYGIKFDASI